jgi:hypothetical protein
MMFASAVEPVRQGDLRPIQKKSRATIDVARPTKIGGGGLAAFKRGGDRFRPKTVVGTQV